MAIPVLNNLDLTLNQLLNALAQVLGTDPGSPTQAQFWFNSTSNRNKHYDGTTVQTDAQLSDSLDKFAAPVANVPWGSQRITTLADPVNAQDAATKNYVDSAIMGIDPHGSVKYMTAAALPAYTYANGTAGVGATITANVHAVWTIDGQSLTVGDRVLVTQGAAGSDNGIYTVTTVGTGSVFTVLTRATDFNTATLDVPGSIVQGAFVFVETGTTEGATGWIETGAGPFTVGTTAITWTQLGAATSYSAGSGITFAGTVISAHVDGVTITTNGSGQLIVDSSATASQTLLSAGTTGTAPTWGALPLGTAAAVSGLLPPVRGGTGIDTSAAANGKLLIGNGSGLSLALVTAGPQIGLPVGAGTLEIDNLTPFKPNATVVATTNVTISNPATAVFDGVTVTSGQRMLLTGQTTTSQNGLWVFNGSSSALTRPTDYAAASTTMAFADVMVEIDSGTVGAGTAWRLTTTGAITVDTTATAWTQWVVNVGANGVVGVLPIANGGTASTSASTARAALGATTKYAVNVPSGSTSAVITHNLGTTDVHVQVWELTGSLRQVNVEVDNTSPNSVTLVFAVAPTSGQYRCVVIG